MPLTVKMRTGVQERVSLAHRLLPELRDWGVALVTVGVRGSVVLSWSHCGSPGPLLFVSLWFLAVSLAPPLPPSAPLPSLLITAPPSQLHGRSREQRYTRLADWPYIEQCAKVASPMPLFGRCQSFWDHSPCCVSQLGRWGDIGSLGDPKTDGFPSTMGLPLPRPHSVS